MIRFTYKLPSIRKEPALAGLAALSQPATILLPAIIALLLSIPTTYYSLSGHQGSATPETAVTGPYLDFTADFIDRALTVNNETRALRADFVTFHGTADIAQQIIAYESQLPRAPWPNVNVYKNTITLLQDGNTLYAVIDATLYCVQRDAGGAFLQTILTPTTIRLQLEGQRRTSLAPTRIRAASITLTRTP